MISNHYSPCTTVAFRMPRTRSSMLYHRFRYPIDQGSHSHLSAGRDAHLLSTSVTPTTPYPRLVQSTMGLSNRGTFSSLRIGSCKLIALRMVKIADQMDADLCSKWKKVPRFFHYPNVFRTPGEPVRAPIPSVQTICVVSFIVLVAWRLLHSR
ncbi:unnamed protein product [Fasciola hepatica]|uniref:Uncharacterized protein n=1 Tax=Fasciola hepatica TaxID=6192 RepID=A0ABC9HGC2_FASHE